MPTIPAFTPTTWVEGAAPGIAAAELNRIDTQVDKLTDGFGGSVELQMAVNDSITNNTFKTLTFGTELRDDWGNTGTNRIDIPGAGIYIAQAMVQWAGDNNGVRAVHIETTAGSPLRKAELIVNSVQGFGFVMQCVFVGFLDGVDDLRVRGFQNSGGSLDVIASSSSRFTVVRLGAP